MRRIRVEQVPGLGHAKAELINEGTVAGLPDEEVRLARFSGART